MVKKISVLNAYCGIGGNRKLWTNVDVTAVEINPEIAKIYQDFFPDDKVIVGDAQQYLLDHYKEFDFIWSSPPCPSHSVCNHFLNAQGVIRYPDMGLWQEILLLQTFAKCKWVIENVKSYYKPLIVPYEARRHYFWSNFYIINKITKTKFNLTNSSVSTRLDSKKYLISLEEYHDIDLSKYNIKDKRKLLRNCVNPELGLHVFNCMSVKKQTTLFENGN